MFDGTSRENRWTTGKMIMSSDTLNLSLEDLDQLIHNIRAPLSSIAALNELAEYDIANKNDESAIERLRSARDLIKRQAELTTNSFYHLAIRSGYFRMPENAITEIGEFLSTFCLSKNFSPSNIILGKKEPRDDTCNEDSIGEDATGFSGKSYICGHPEQLKMALFGIFDVCMAYSADMQLILELAFRSRSIRFSLSTTAKTKPHDLLEFFQDNSTSTIKSQGHLLSLSNSRTLIEASGGHFSFVVEEKENECKIIFVFEMSRHIPTEENGGES